jgi:phosphoglucomutase
MAQRDIEELLGTWTSQVSEPDLAAELAEMSRCWKAGDRETASDAFFQDLAFGTAGLRGVIGAGTNRMNVYTVGRATQGLADYLNATYDNPTVAIARDSRNMGEAFVRTAAGVLAANGIHAMLYPRIEPTPALSFAVRDLKASAGINMTASHNPAEYNGYKVYGPDGCQIASEVAADISDAIEKVDYFGGIKTMDFDEAQQEGLVTWIGEDTLDRFIDAVAAQSLDDEGGQLKVVYTPLNGTGLECVRRILDRIGVTDVHVVPEQEKPDGNFPTCPYPNPEIREALECGIQLCEKVHPDLLLATDPDADRVGTAVRDGDDYTLITGNEMGVLLLDYVARKRQERGEDLSRAVAVTTIVSSAMVDDLAKAYGFQLRRVLTGFKYIGGQIGQLEAAGEADRFIFGFEESYGYLAGTHVRDKDAVVASMLICEMARDYRARGMNLADGIRELYERYGYCFNRTVSLAYPGADGAAQMAAIMKRLRTDPPQEFAGIKVRSTVDYAPGVEMPRINAPEGEAAQKLDGANVVEFDLDGSAKVIVRPSGTEPKIKMYLFAKGSSAQEATSIIDRLDEAVRSM